MKCDKNTNASELPAPETLVEAVRVFGNEDVALRFMAHLRWGGIENACCPRCGSVRVRFISTRRVWECKEDHASKRFSIKTNTVMEESPLPLGTWLVAIWLEANAKNSISSYEVHRGLGITQKSAWFLQQRIRLAMQNGDFFKQLTGDVEVDETFIGGKARNMHASKRKAVITSPGVAGKTAVMGLLARHTGEVRTKVIPNTKRRTLHPIVREHVELGANVYSDSHPAYVGLDPDYVHEVVDHAECYVRGNVHTNGLENFWSLFKRCIKGTHVSVEPFHLFRYLDAETFRFNNRKMDDGARFFEVVQSVSGKRLTYKSLTGESQSEFLS
jgi:transposase-like protein